MALPLGKITLLVGAGIIGSILAKEGRLPSFSDVVSGALKVALKPGKSDSSASTTKPRNEALIAQVNNLRQELQLLASNRPITIMTSSQAGGRPYGVIIVIVVIGYGYVWWKGWKLPGFMFATKRSLSDACNSVAKQLDQVYSSITTTKKDLASKLDESSHKYEDIIESTVTTKDEIAKLRGGVSKFNLDINHMNSQFRNLETKWGNVESRQGVTLDGVEKLMLITQYAEKNRFTDAIQDSPSSSSRPALECPQITINSRTISLPPGLSLDCPSPSASNGSSEVTRHLRHAISDIGPSPKECQGISGATVDNAARANGTHISENSQRPPVSESPQTLPNKTPGLLTRTISMAQYFKFK